MNPILSRHTLFTDIVFIEAHFGFLVRLLVPMGLRHYVFSLGGNYQGLTQSIDSPFTNMRLGIPNSIEDHFKELLDLLEEEGWSSQGQFS